MTNQETKSAPNPFDPASLRLSQDYTAEVAVEKVLSRVRVGKPNKQDFVRTHPAPEYHLDTGILVCEEDRETYLVMPRMHGELASELRPVRLYTAISRQGVLFLWPCQLPDSSGQHNPWHRSAMEAAELAKTSWIRVTADQGLGAYQPYRATGNLPDPEWPRHSMAELLEKAFQNHTIASPDHPVVARLRGLR